MLTQAGATSRRDPPTDPDVRISRIRFVTPPSGNARGAPDAATHGPCVDRLMGHRVPAGFPTVARRRFAPFPPRGSRGTSSPASTLLWGAATPARPSARAHWV